MEELKPCPFCGNLPRISEADHYAECVISCNCHAVPQVVQRCVSVQNEDGKTFHYDNQRAKREAIDIWNSRHAPSAMIIQKFGQRPIPSVEEIEKVIFIESEKSLKKHNKIRTMEVSQAIHDLLTKDNQ